MVANAKGAADLSPSIYISIQRIATCIHACMLLVDLSTIYTIEAAAKMGRSPLVFILATVIVAMGEDEEGEEGPMSVSQGEGETFVTQ